MRAQGSADMAERNIKLTIAYDGTDFHGYQRQPEVRTVQGELEKTLQGILRAPVTTEAASRTDAGVHARGQVVNFHTTNALEAGRLAAALNGRLPDDIAVVEADDVEGDFSSRFSARGKLYSYLILNTALPDPLLRRRALYVPSALDIEAMSAAAVHIRGERDYAAFGVKAAQQESTVCDIERVCVEQAPCNFFCVGQVELVRIEVQGDRFLYRMVRTIAGTILEVGKGKFTPEEISGIIKSRDRGNAGPTLKPHGLYLVRVIY